MTLQASNVSIAQHYLRMLFGKVIIICICLTGETDDASIRALRSRQMKNFHLALMISQVHIRNTFGVLRLFVNRKLCYSISFIKCK